MLMQVMAYFNNDDLEFVDNYYEGSDFDDEEPDSHNHSVDSDFEDEFESSTSKSDTSALEARNGKDIQGIPWDRLNFTRDKYRQTRLQQYKNYENLSHSRQHLQKECLEVEKGNTFYDFQFNTRIVKSTIVHFQLFKQGGSNI